MIVFKKSSISLAIGIKSYWILPQGVDIDEKQLLIIYDLIQNNQYALVDSHYNEVLYNYISEKTSMELNHIEFYRK